MRSSRSGSGSTSGSNSSTGGVSIAALGSFVLMLSTGFFSRLKFFDLFDLFRFLYAFDLRRHLLEKRFFHRIDIIFSVYRAVLTTPHRRQDRLAT
jgi:hypothetical protein